MDGPGLVCCRDLSVGVLAFWNLFDGIRAIRCLLAITFAARRFGRVSFGIRHPLTAETALS